MLGVVYCVGKSCWVLYELWLKEEITQIFVFHIGRKRIYPFPVEPQLEGGLTWPHGLVGDSRPTHIDNLIHFYFLLGSNQSPTCFVLASVSTKPRWRDEVRIEYKYAYK